MQPYFLAGLEMSAASRITMLRSSRIALQNLQRLSEEKASLIRIPACQTTLGRAILRGKAKLQQRLSQDCRILRFSNVYPLHFFRRARQNMLQRIKLNSQVLVARSAQFANRGAPRAESGNGGIFSLAARLKDVMQEYGKLAAAFHLSGLVLTTGIFYAGLYMGVVDLEPWFDRLPAQLAESVKNGSGNLAAAFVLAECTAPPRYALTIAVVPKIAPWVRSHSWARRIFGLK
uniref:DUF1279 domain-containing protein n=1 Tax=Hanusia phi TaxID=3032 RepID=A0A7S0NDV2_9CRYP